jgi:hypothetical protein
MEKKVVIGIGNTSGSGSEIARDRDRKYIEIGNKIFDREQLRDYEFIIS